MASVRTVAPVLGWERVWPAAGTAWTIAAVSLAAAAAIVAAAGGGRAPIVVAVIGVSAAVLAMLGVIDARTRTVPNRLVYPALGVALAVALIDPARSFGGALAAAAFAGGLYAVAFYVKPSALFRGTLAVPAPRRGSADDVKWGGAAGAIALLVAALAQPEQSAAGAFAAAAIAGCPFLPYFLVDGWGIHDKTPVTAAVRGMGGGDVKLAALLGTLAGAPAVLSVLPVAVFGGAVAALTLVFVRCGGTAIPYGPFLAAGAVLAIL
ncbi:MAG: A24 family peptidase [Gemmatimonadaceae bacterium]